MRYISIYDVFDMFPEIGQYEKWFDENKLQMYKEVRRDKEGNEFVAGYRFGEPAQAAMLFFEGSRFETEEEAMLAWYKENFK